MKHGCTIECSMKVRLVAVGIVLALASTARAAVLRVSAEPPLSAERLSDALRSYLDGVEVTLASPSIDADSATVGSRLGPAEIGIRLRAYHSGGQDAEVMLVDGEETILARLPGAIRSEDLYRAAALKVQAQAMTAVLGLARPVSAATSRVQPRASPASALKTVVHIYASRTAPGNLPAHRSPAAPVRDWSAVEPGLAAAWVVQAVCAGAPCA
jgi:hypothetical protein